MNSIKWIFLGAVGAILCACAGSGTQADSAELTAPPYPSTAPANVNISSHPPKGTYIVIARLTINVRQGETAGHALKRLQQKGADVGADYVMVTSISDKTFITPQNLDTQVNPYISSINSFYSTANSTDPGYSQTYMREVIKAQALKITSGSNAPNDAAPSKLWQSD
ncbi:MAG: hypothetical protein LV480_03075 [Methylacidiphilales bacterium]|nr:hypothetical protein [Candidatus Methylacidiphilales bacterium]